jgi:hypothetical protein
MRGGFRRGGRAAPVRAGDLCQRSCDKIFWLAYVAAQDHVVHEVDDLGHGRVRAAVGLVRARELYRFAIAKEAARQEEVVDVGRGRFEVERVHGGKASVSRGSAAIVQFIKVRERASFRVPFLTWE